MSVLAAKFKDYRIILASQSPRRKELLKGIGLSFDIQPTHCNEDFPKSLKQEAIPLYICEQKAAAFPLSKEDAHTILITADTIVIKEGEILHKPLDRTDAIRILSTLSNGVHEVITGVCIKSSTKLVSFWDKTLVHIKPLTLTEIETYIDECQPYDKAGSYGIQEWFGYAAITHMDGSFYTVMGLPTHKLYDELLKF